MTTHWVKLQPAYILYARSFRETSLLVEAFTRDYGRISLVARGARSAVGGKKRPRQYARFQGLLQPFVPLLLSWYGRTELLNLTAAEPNGILPAFQGQLLICGFYVNELISRVLHRFDAHSELFQAYHYSLSHLAAHPQKHLRLFEKKLLTALGFAPRLDYEMKTNYAVKPDQWYLFTPGQGLSRCQAEDLQISQAVFRGAGLLALQEDRLEQPDNLRDAKRLLRLMLDHHLLAGVTIRSRELLG